MTQTIPANVQASLDGGEISIRELIRFDFSGQSHGFWTGTGPLTWPAEPNPLSLVYNPGGGLLEVEEIAFDTEMVAKAIAITLRSVPDTDLTPDVLATIHEEDYHQRPVTIYHAYFNTDTRELLNVVPVFAGFVDTIDYIVNPKSGEAMLKGKAESYLRDLTRRGASLASDDGQQFLAAGDLFFEHANKAGDDLIYWGRKDPKAAKNWVPKLGRRPFRALASKAYSR